ncbi:MAG: MAPEG family protein [Rhodanobacteraceae bacterium]|nr:MAPEG family protein [Rhodanobacteraceae bacterium]
MPIAYWCVLAAAFMPLLYTAIAKFSGGGYNNRKVPEFQARLSGFRQRAHWAHTNRFEAFPPFAAGVIIAHQLGANADRIDQLAVAFIVLRLVYGGFYLADLHWQRSLAWSAAFACTVALYFSAAAA